MITWTKTAAIFSYLISLSLFTRIALGKEAPVVVLLCDDSTNNLAGSCTQMKIRFEKAGYRPIIIKQPFPELIEKDPQLHGLTQSTPIIMHFHGEMNGKEHVIKSIKVPNTDHYSDIPTSQVIQGLNSRFPSNFAWLGPCYSGGAWPGPKSCIGASCTHLQLASLEGGHPFVYGARIEVSTEAIIRLFEDKTLFSLFDKNKDGSMDSNELAAYLRVALGQQSSSIERYSISEDTGTVALYKRIKQARSGTIEQRSKITQEELTLIRKQRASEWGEDNSLVRFFGEASLEFEDPVVRYFKDNNLIKPTSKGTPQDVEDFYKKFLIRKGPLSTNSVSLPNSELVKAHLKRAANMAQEFIYQYQLPKDLRGERFEGKVTIPEKLPPFKINSAAKISPAQLTVDLLRTDGPSKFGFCEKGTIHNVQQPLLGEQLRLAPVNHQGK